MRQGQVLKRCTKCGARVADKRCPNCGSDRPTWAFVVDTAPVGSARRQQAKRGGFATKAAALAAMAKLQEEKAEGTFIEPTKLTVAAYLATWIEGGAGGRVRGSTLTGYEVAVRVHIVPRLGSIPLQQLTRADIERLYQELRERGYAKGNVPGRPLSAKSVHNIHVALRKALADAMDRGLIRSNPAERAHQAPGEHEAPEMLSWAAQEVRTFLEVTASDPLHPLWRLAVQTGMRRGELLGLRWADVDLEHARVAVRQQLIHSGPEPAFGPPKTRAGRRSIALDQRTVAILEAHHQVQASGRIFWGQAYAKHDLVFARPDGRPHDPDSIAHQFGAAGSRARVKRIRFHDLRHTCASLALQAGIHPKVVQGMLGHSSITITLDRYSHLVPSMQEDAAATLGRVVDGL